MVDLSRHTRFLLSALLMLLLTALATPSACAQDLPPHAAPTTRVQIMPLPPIGAENFDPTVITNAYLAKVNGAAREKSDAYFEGGYALSVIDVLWMLALCGIILFAPAAVQMRGRIKDRFPAWKIRTPILILFSLLLLLIGTLPLSFYEGFLREHAYGMSNQSFGAWAGEYLLQNLITLIVGTLLFWLIYAAARKLRRYWWLCGAGLTIAFLAVMILVQPVFIEPLFNHYTPLPDSGLKSAILAEASANGVPAKNVYVFDASRQTKRISANVSGLLGTTRIALNDNLLDQCTPSQVLAVLAHEIGHYVLNHVFIMLGWFALVYAVLFGLVALSFNRLVRRFGERLGVTDVADAAGLPLMIGLFAFFMFWATPAVNGITRTAEMQADIFGLNAARQPDAFAEVALKVSNYRKLDPSAFEEFWFYDHPSGRTRILTAMRWKKAHLYDPDIAAGPVSPGQVDKR